MKIVVGHHITPEGQAALDRATALVRDRGGELHLVDVVRSAQGDVEGPGDGPSRAEVQRRLETAAREHAAEGVECRTHLPHGVQRPADAILAVAREVAADLIVIGLRRRSRVGKLVLGSTAQDILLGSECDVLCVKRRSSTAG